MTCNTRCIVSRLARFVLVTPDATKLAAFYEQALGCTVRPSERLSAVSLTQLGINGGAAGTTLELGHQTIDLIQCDRPGKPISADAVSYDLAFQHFAIVVSDMQEAYRRLSASAGWQAISVGGPKRLPDSSGGVTAFKFRDPDGHPLELLAFPRDHVPMHWREAVGNNYCIGIDHSAISVSDVATSMAFYEAIGLETVSRTVNDGTEQACLDAVHEPHVDVIALAPGQRTPHLELLGYRRIMHDKAKVTDCNDIAATRLVFEADDDRTTSRSMIDPDGHRIVIEPRSCFRP